MMYIAPFPARFSLILPLLLGLSGCALFERGREEAPRPGADLATEFAPAVSVQPLGAAGYAPEALDQTSEAEKRAALAAPAAGGERELGRAVVALGPPAEAGLWVRTSLVSAPGQGRVVVPGGRSLAVELRPTSGGALMSFSAYQTLGIGLTELPEVTIYGR
ncbi:hypothetical protein [Pseudogemmobacter sonorensis]|uniref:hypothetical protein n=1 Tax=Pseudogemmobacter sonorensis TaxID=2989681 RepID=UPI0036A25F8F